LKNIICSFKPKILLPITHLAPIASGVSGTAQHERPDASGSTEPVLCLKLGKNLDIELKELPNYFDFFLPLAGSEVYNATNDNEADRKDTLFAKQKKTLRQAQGKLKKKVK